MDNGTSEEDRGWSDGVPWLRGGLLDIAWSIEDLDEYCTSRKVAGSPSSRLNPDELALAMLTKTIQILRWDVGESPQTKQLVSILGALEKDLKERRERLPARGNWWPRILPPSEWLQEPLREEELRDPEFGAWLERGRRYRLGGEILAGE